MAFKSSFLIFAALNCAGFAATLAAQDVASIPAARGVYYKADSGWVGLSSTLLVPMISGTTAELFSVGRRQAIAEVPGMHASLQTTNARPTMYVRGFALNNGIYLVKQVQKQEYREIHMPISGNFRDFAQFRAKDLREIEIRSVGNGVIAVTPVRDLAPGEYSIVSTFEPNNRDIKMGFDFGVAGGPRK